MMNCQEALELLYDILDKEASEVNSKEVKEHLSKCSDCFKKFKLEEQVQSFLNEKLSDNNNQESTSVCLDSLKSKITLQLDDIDNESCSDSSSKRNFFSPGRMLLAAAALVVMVFTGFYLSGYVKHFKNFEPLEQAHISSAQNLNQFAKAGSKSVYFTNLKSQFDYDLKPDVMGYSLLGGKQEKIMGVPMEHLVYVNDDELISVFIVSSNQFTIPSDVVDEVILLNNIEYFDHHCHGCRLVYHEVGDLIVITATVNHDFKLLEFNPGTPRAI